MQVSPDNYPTDYTPLNQGQFLSLFKQCIDEIDSVNALLKRMNGIKKSMQSEAIKRCNSEDISKLAGDGITITVKEMPVVKLDPETDWSSVLTKLCDDGYAHMVQRRLSAGKLREESDAGYRLPDGVTIEEIQVANHRRSS
jgi:hypothetical protein